MDKGLWIDLHAHTTASDGDLSPSELVEAAHEAGLAAVAVTDHDTVEGVPEAWVRGRELGVEVVAGLEISVQLDPGRTFHLLGYYLDISQGSLGSTLQRLQRARQERNEGMLARLAALGRPIAWDLLSRCARGGQLGRPHMAKAMVAQGYVASVEEAFQRFLGKGAPAYVERFRPGPEEAMAMVRDARGIPVLAHPHSLDLQGPLELEAFVARWTEKAGLMGIEVRYPDHGIEEEGLYRRIAAKYGLLMTGGTDFHGGVKPAVRLGWGRGDLRVPRAWAEEMRRRARELREVRISSQ